MITDRYPRSGARREQYDRSDSMTQLIIPQDDRLRAHALVIESALSSGATAPVRTSCTALLNEAASFYGVVPPKVRVLASRPLRVYERGTTELFGDYDLMLAAIRVWMRTAVQHRVTSFGTFLSTLCHEFCHHLDAQSLGFRDSPHTRGFYARTAVLYHHARGRPMKRLVWVRVRGGRWRIDWPRTNRG